MAAVCGPDSRRVMDEVLGADLVSDAVRDSQGFFTSEAPALNAWEFDPAAVTQPVLLVQGGDSLPLEHRLVAHLASRLRHATVATVEHVNHLLPLTAPAEIARLISGMPHA